MFDINLFPTESASLRTKNRLHEHGPKFTPVKTSNPKCMNGEPSLLVISCSDDWFGWLPLNEVIQQTAS